MLEAIPIRLPPPKQDVGEIRGVRGCLLSRNMCCVIIKIIIYVRSNKSIFYEDVSFVRIEEGME